MTRPAKSSNLYPVPFSRTRHKAWYLFFESTEFHFTIEELKQLTPLLSERRETDAAFLENGFNMRDITVQLLPASALTGKSISSTASFFKNKSNAMLTVHFPCVKFPSLLLPELKRRSGYELRWGQVSLAFVSLIARITCQLRSLRERPTSSQALRGLRCKKEFLVSRLQSLTSLP